MALGALFSRKSSGGENLDFIHLIIFIIMYSVLIILIILGNGLVIFVYCKNKPVRDIRFNGQILALTVADFFVALISIPAFVHAELFADTHLPGWNLFHEWAFHVPIVMSVFVVIIISYDRVRLVTNPIKYHTSKTYRQSTQTTMLVWIGSACYACLYDVILLISFEVFLPPKQRLQNVDEYLVAILTDYGQVVIYFLTPFTILVVTNWIFVVRWRRKLKVLKTRANIGGRGNSTIGQRTPPVHYENAPVEATLSTISGNVATALPSSSSISELRRNANLRVRFLEPHEDQDNIIALNNRERKLYKIARNLLFLDVAFLVCWLPFNVMTCIRLFITLPKLVLHICYFLLFLNSAINPFIYATISPTFRQAIYKSICLVKAALIKVKSNNSTS
ncbi:tyramine receptor Ser-2-like [Apostichopus japonicus]|uniref:tyramine receptor Ser-2-like n=1 Tax=Stichopus japonicus TaxID=307972 RepID=UPI003AB7E77F